LESIDRLCSFGFHPRRLWLACLRTHGQMGLPLFTQTTLVITDFLSMLEPQLPTLGMRLQRLGLTSVVARVAEHSQCLFTSITHRPVGITARNTSTVM
jgi:hypothetical protein